MTDSYGFAAIFLGGPAAGTSVLLAAESAVVDIASIPLADLEHGVADVKGNVQPIQSRYELATSIRMLETGVRVLIYAVVGESEKYVNIGQG